MLRGQLETQRALEDRGWLVVETRGDDTAGWACHLVFRGDQWGVVLYREGRIADMRSCVRDGLSEESARLAFAAAPDIPPRAWSVPTKHLKSLARVGDRIYVDAASELVAFDRGGTIVWRDRRQQTSSTFKLATRGTLLALDAHFVEIWDTKSRERKRVLRIGGAVGAAFLEDGRDVMTVTTDGSLMRWRNSKMIERVSIAPRINCMASNGQLVACAGKVDEDESGHIVIVDGDLRTVREIETTVEPAEFEPNTIGRGLIAALAFTRDSAGVLAIAWHPDGRHVVTGGADFVVKMFDTTTGACERAWIGHSHWVTGVSVDEHRIASCSFDGTVRVWDYQGNCLVKHRCDDVVGDVLLDDERIYAACNDGNVYVFP